MNLFLVTIIDTNHAVLKYPGESPAKPKSVDKVSLTAYEELLKTYNEGLSDFRVQNSTMYEVESFLRDDGVLHNMNSHIYCIPGSHHEAQILEGNNISLLKGWKSNNK